MHALFLTAATMHHVWWSSLFAPFLPPVLLLDLSLVETGCAVVNAHAQQCYASMQDNNKKVVWDNIQNSVKIVKIPGNVSAARVDFWTKGWKNLASLLGRRQARVQRSAKRWPLGCMNSRPVAKGARRRDSRNLGPAF